MSADEAEPSATRTRRPPPPFRRVVVESMEMLTPRMRRVVLAGDELAGMVIDEPASSVRLLLPADGSTQLVMPTWTGNQFELPDGRRAPIRTFTPRRLDGTRLTIDIVAHGRGAAADWAARAEIGDAAAVSGPGRGYTIDPGVRSFLLAGDETALPAISQLLEELPHDRDVVVHAEVADQLATLPLPPHPRATVAWHTASPGAVPGEAFASAVEAIGELPDAIWIAGEAAAVQRLRRWIYDGRGVDRTAVSAHGYWKHGRSAT